MQLDPPLIISTWSFGQRGNRLAWPILSAGGDSLDAVERACTEVERDPEVDSVGLGGLPDSGGEVTVDAAVMFGPDRHGSVCFVRDIISAASLARRVMEATDHAMLAGAGAQDFASAQGFERVRLLSDAAQAKWRSWKEKPDRPPVDQSQDRGLAALRPVDRDQSGRLFHGDSEERWRHHDTIGTLAVDGHGVMAGACSTSGTPFKAPGRVGDSPIVGHGLYVDPEVGGAVATGTGELIMGVCGSFLIVELMRAGAEPREAVEAALRRIEHTHDLRADHQVGFIALKHDGSCAAGSLRAGFKVAVRDGRRDSVEEPEIVLRVD